MVHCLPILYQIRLKINPLWAKKEPRKINSFILEGKNQPKAPTIASLDA